MVCDQAKQNADHQHGTEQLGGDEQSNATIRPVDHGDTHRILFDFTNDSRISNHQPGIVEGNDSHERCLNS